MEQCSLNKWLITERVETKVVTADSRETGQEGTDQKISSDTVERTTQKYKNKKPKKHGVMSGLLATTLRHWVITVTNDGQRSLRYQSFNFIHVLLNSVSDRFVNARLEGYSSTNQHLLAKRNLD